MFHQLYKYYILYKCYFASNDEAFISSFSSGRSRSPVDSKFYKEDLRKHRSRHRESDRSTPHRHRDHSSHRRDDSEHDTFYKDKYARREERKSASHSYSPVRRHNHGHSHSKDRH